LERYILTEKSGSEKSLIESMYSKLEINREVFLERARDSAELTIPTLFPPKGANESTNFPTPYQSVGSRGVMNLASKLMLALFPPQAPFFRLGVDDLVYKKLQQDPQQKSVIELGLAQIEKAVMDNIEATSDRVNVYEMLKHLIVGGNCLLKITDNGLRVYRLENYVIKRDGEGNLLKLIIKESISPSSLPKEIATLITKKLDEEQKHLHLYTYVYKEPNKFCLVQEVSKIQILKKEYKLDELPFLPLRFNRVDGQDYGRGLVEHLLGDLKSLEGLTRAILEGSTAMAKCLFLVSPNGSTRPSSIAKAPNGAIIEGNSADVTVLQMNKFADFRVALETVQRVEQRLQMSFLLNSSVARQAERVTATEISLIANELQDALGGVYGLLTAEFQLPYLKTKLSLLRSQKLLPELPKDIVKPKIIVGLEALARSTDRIRLLQFLSDLASTLGQQALAQYINLDDLIKKFAVSNNIDTAGLLKSPEQIQQEQQANQLQQFATKALADPRVVNEFAKANQDNPDVGNVIQELGNSMVQT